MMVRKLRELPDTDEFKSLLLDLFVIHLELSPAYVQCGNTVRRYCTKAEHAVCTVSLLLTSKYQKDLFHTGTLICTWQVRRVAGTWTLQTATQMRQQTCCPAMFGADVKNTARPTPTPPTSEQLVLVKGKLWPRTACMLSITNYSNAVA